MSRKDQLMIAEGISKKNILPQFGTNNKPNIKLEQDMRKFMYEKKPLTENLGVLGTIGSAAMDLAAKAEENKDSENKEEPVSDTSGTAVTEAQNKIRPSFFPDYHHLKGEIEFGTNLAYGRGLDTLRSGPEYDPEVNDKAVRKDIISVGKSVIRHEKKSGEKSNPVRGEEGARHPLGGFVNLGDADADVPEMGYYDKHRIVNPDEEYQRERQIQPVPAIGKSHRMPGHGPDESMVKAFINDLYEGAYVNTPAPPNSSVRQIDYDKEEEEWAAKQAAEKAARASAPKADNTIVYDKYGPVRTYHKEKVIEALMGTETPEDRGRLYRKHVAQDIKQARRTKSNTPLHHGLEDAARTIAAGAENLKNPDAPSGVKDILKLSAERNLDKVYHYGYALNHMVHQKNVVEATVPGEKLSRADRNDIAAELRGARSPHSSVTNRLMHDLVRDEKANVDISKEEGEPKSVIKNSEDRLAHYRLALGMRKGLMRKKMGF